MMAALVDPAVRKKVLRVVFISLLLDLVCSITSDALYRAYHFYNLNTANQNFLSTDFVRPKKAIPKSTIRYLAD